MMETCWLSPWLSARQNPGSNQNKKSPARCESRESLEWSSLGGSSRYVFARSFLAKTCGSQYLCLGHLFPFSIWILDMFINMKDICVQLVKGNMKNCGSCIQTRKSESCLQISPLSPSTSKSKSSAPASSTPPPPPPPPPASASSSSTSSSSSSVCRHNDSTYTCLAHGVGSFLPVSCRPLSFSPKH